MEVPRQLAGSCPTKAGLYQMTSARRRRRLAQSHAQPGAELQLARLAMMTGRFTLSRLPRTRPDRAGRASGISVPCLYGEKEWNRRLSKVHLTPNRGEFPFRRAPRFRVWGATRGIPVVTRLSASHVKNPLPPHPTLPTVASAFLNQLARATSSFLSRIVLIILNSPLSLAHSLLHLSISSSPVPLSQTRRALATSAIMSKTLSQSDVVSHDKPDSLWIVVDGDVYDLTKFQEEHPGAFPTVPHWAASC